jgi:DNA-binding LytR/AlgR family response regulator
MTLKGILEKLPPKDFMRVHRSYIVPISKIDRFSKSKIWVGEKEIPVGSSYGSVYDQLLAHSQAK